MKTPLVIGLHITKCAGTSLASLVRQTLPPKAWYICSEFVDNQRNANLELLERLYLKDLRFIFGHYIHQSLVPMFQNRRILLVAGVREPVARAVSEYYHMCSVRARSGREPLSADDFLSVRSNTMCMEVLRAFPAGHSVPGDVATKAARVLEIFNLIYSNEDIEESTRPLRRLLNLPDNNVPVVNVRDIETENSEYLAEQADILKRKSPEAFAADIDLYAQLQPRIGQWRGAPLPWIDWWNGQQNGGPPWFRPVMQSPSPYEDLLSHQTRFMVRNFQSAGQIGELNALIERKRLLLDRLSSELSKLK